MNFVSSITLSFKDAFSSGFNDAKDSLAGMKGALDDMANNPLNRLAADMAMMNAMTEPMRKALSDAMDQPSRIAGSLETSFKSIQIATSATGEEMAVVRRELLSIGGRAAAGPHAVASAFGNVASGIADAASHMEVLNAAVALSEANQLDLGAASNALVNVFNAWGLEAQHAGLASDILTQTAIMGVGSIDEFASSISTISTLAASAGVGLDELGASFAYATNKGLSAGQVQKQLKGIITTLVSPSESLSNLYASLGIESGQAMIEQYGLAESLSILKNAVGDDRAFSDMIGSLEAATVALALTEDAYVDFAASFGEGMQGVTQTARGVQLESLEMKMARLDSVSASLQAQVGQDINNIKGYFVDFKFGFLSHIVSPLMASPLGGVLSKTAAVTGVFAKGILDAGSTAMNTAAQMTTLAANISNAGGLAKMAKSSFGIMGAATKALSSPLRGVGGGLLGVGKSVIASLPAMGAWIASMWAAAAAHIAAFWPVYAVIGAVALLAAGVYLLIKNWDSVSGFFVGLWEKIKSAFFAAWDWIKNLLFGTSDWILAAVAIFMPIIGIPALIIKHWDSIKTFFVNLWDNPKETILGFIEWVGGKVADLVAPFKVVGDIVGGVFNKVGGFFRGIVGGSRESGSALNDAFAEGIQSNENVTGQAFSKSIEPIANQMPHSDAPQGPLSTLTASGRALTEIFASGMDEDILREKADIVFSAASPSAGGCIEFPISENTAKSAGTQTIHIQNLYVQADECETIFDFIKMLMHSVQRPVEAGV